MAISGYTKVVGVIGCPVRHSLSPAIHNAAFEAMGLDWCSLAFEVNEGQAATAVSGMKAMDIQGLSVTMPHKAAVVAALDALAPSAEVLGVVNCIAWTGASLVGHNTDGVGFVQSVEAEAGFGVAGSSCAVIGAGGAARSIIHALVQAGARDVAVVNRSAEAAASAAELGGLAVRVATDEVAAAAIHDAELVINATSVGMGASGECPFDPSLLSDSQVVVDIVYNPLETPLLGAARERGLRAFNGVAMLVYQAAEQLRLWTGQEPDVAAMTAKANSVLQARQ